MHIRIFSKKHLLFIALISCNILYSHTPPKISPIKKKSRAHQETPQLVFIDKMGNQFNPQQDEWQNVANFGFIEKGVLHLVRKNCQ